MTKPDTPEVSSRRELITPTSTKGPAIRLIGERPQSLAGGPEPQFRTNACIAMTCLKEKSGEGTRLSRHAIDLTSLLRFIVLYVALYAAFGSASPFLPPFLSARGLGPEQIALVLAAGTAIRLISAPIVGRLADLFGALRLALSLCALAASLAALGYLPSRGFALLLIVGVAHAAALAPLTPVSDALALGAAQGEAGQRGFEYGWVRGSGSAAFIVGSILAGYAVSARGITIIPWFNAALLAGAGAAALFVPPLVRRPDRQGSPEWRAEHIQTLVRIPAFRRVVLVAALILGSHALHDGFAMIRWNQAGIDPGFASLLWSESVAAEVVVFFAIGPALLRRLGCAGAAMLAAAAGAVRWSVAANTAAASALLFIQPLHGLTFALLHLACLRVIAAIVPPGLEATAQAIYGTVGIGGATVVLTLASGVLYEHFGAAGFWVMAALCATAVPVASLLPGRPPTNGC